MNSTLNYGPDSQYVTCPHCLERVKTDVKSKATSRTHLIALLLCICLCWLCVCCPYCMKSCRNRNHYCPNCKAFLGNYQA